MLRSLKDLDGYAIGASDGDIGRVVDFLLDDERWIVRYLVAKTGRLFGGRHVLVSPISFRQAEWSTRRFHLALTVNKIKSSPSVDLDKPISREHEREHFAHYEYPPYWGYTGQWGIGAYPGLLASARWKDAPAQRPEESNDVHLRSAKQIRGYHIEGTDAAIGHLDDFIIDDETWEVRYLVVDTRNWWLDKKVLVAPHWANRISWTEAKVFVDMSRQEIKDSPEWSPTAPINREYEARLYDYYGRPVYWDSGDKTAPAQEHRPG
jgi:hypothetical protein